MQKKILVALGIITGLALVSNALFQSEVAQNLTFQPESKTPSTPLENHTTEFEEKIIAQNLDTPWGIDFLPDGSIIFTERQGSISRLDLRSGERNILGRVSSAKESGEGGLLGIAVHPQFQETPEVFVYYTFAEKDGQTRNRVSRFVLEENRLDKEEILLDNIPGASFHNGGIIRFGPDGFLYVGTGDANTPSQAQDTKSLAGKILRLTTDGQPAPQNPFQNEVYSYGHRNVQGLAWDESGKLFATEHGRSGVRSGFDELNHIQAGGNYGWPDSEGNNAREGTIAPQQHSGESTTWAPAGLAFTQNQLFFGGLRGQALYVSQLTAGAPQPVTRFKEGYGRIRAVATGPDGSLYFATSNKDGRGSPQSGDDKIIQLSAKK